MGKIMGAEKGHHHHHHHHRCCALGGGEVILLLPTNAVVEHYRGICIFALSGLVLEKGLLRTAVMLLHSFKTA